MTTNSTPITPTSGRARHTTVAPHGLVAADILKPICQAGAGLALANWADNTQPDCLGILTAVIDVTTVEYAFAGEVNGFTGLVDDTTYWGGITPGTISASVPVAVGNVPQAVGQAVGTTKLLVSLGARQAVIV